MPKRSGFTLIELMIVVAIIGLLASIAIPKFADLVIRSKEASIKGKLGSLRSALSIYYSDNEGLWPSGGATEPGPSLTLGGKYLQDIPFISVPTVPLHANANGFYRFPSPITDSMFQSSFKLSWYYNSTSGALAVNCTHLDSRGTIWSTF